MIAKVVGGWRGGRRCWLGRGKGKRSGGELLELLGRRMIRGEVTRLLKRMRRRAGRGW